jgi:hypothetical protein
MNGVYPYQGLLPRNPLAKMLPNGSIQAMVYRHGEASPPGFEGYTPLWETVTFVFTSRQSQQFKLAFHKAFTLFAINASSSVDTVGGFRFQLYDVLRKIKLTDRGVNYANLTGEGENAMFLREPYEFQGPEAQCLILASNLEPAANTVQLVLYGMGKRIDQ